MIYLYGIAAGQDVEPRGDGIEGAPLLALHVGSLTAVYSVHRKLEPRPDPEQSWAHQRVLERLMDTDTVLPARFASTFADVRSLEEAVARQRSALEHQLAQVGGCVELAVRALRPEPDQNDAPQDGRSYLLARLSASRQRQDLVQHTLAALNDVSRESRTLPGDSSTGVVRISYLVRTPDVQRFSGEVSRLALEHPELALSCTGPWPPYSFAGQGTA